MHPKEICVSEQYTGIMHLRSYKTLLKKHLIYINDICISLFGLKDKNINSK